MIALIQRVSAAHVEVGGEVIGQIATGLLALVAIEPGDGEQQAGKLLDKIVSYRVFEDEAGRMNRSLRDIDGGLLLVPQFTLAADTGSGLRPSFSTCAAPEDGRRWFGYLLDLAHESYPHVACGRFGADMQVHLVNDGPATFWLQF